MKHLRAFKLFESNSNLWQPITGEEWSQRESIWGKDVPIDEKDKQAIRHFVNTFYKEPNWDFSLSSLGDKIEIDICNQSKSDFKLLLLVTKTPDEWYLVKEYFYRWHKGGKFSSWRQATYKDLEGRSVYESYYKCDTIDGLIELLKARREWLYTKS